MSMGQACRVRAHRAVWIVTHLHHNHSAFRGYWMTASDYSEVRCPSCPAFWRTRAKYVSGLTIARHGCVNL